MVKSGNGIVTTVKEVGHKKKKPET